MMKTNSGTFRLRKSIICYLIFIFLAAACAPVNNRGGGNSNSDGGPALLQGNDAPEQGYLRIHYNGVQAKAGDSTTWSVWVFEDVMESCEDAGRSWPKGFVFTHVDSFGVYIDIQLKEDPEKVGIVVVDSGSGTKGSGDSDIVFYFPKKYNQIYLKEGSSVVYVNSELAQEPSGLISAAITAKTELRVSVSGVTPEASMFTVYKYNSNETINVTNVSRVSGNNYTLTIADTDYIAHAPYKVVFDDGSGIEDTVYANITSALIDSEFAYTGEDLGWHNGTAKVWAPLASEVNVLTYDDMKGAEADFKAPIKSMTDNTIKGNRAKMERGEKGVWSASVTEGKYYMYEVKNGETVTRVCDIYANAASPDSVAALAVDINTSANSKPSGWSETYVNPFGNNKNDSKSYTEAVIYEMHIRDWSRAFVKNSTGKFEDITAALADGAKFSNHLKDLGVTHVQILPMFDYAEKNSDLNYNWGYNPYQYNVPEGRYVNNHDGSAEEAVKQMRAMIQAFHNAGIAVNMDVVYNHTNGTGEGSLFDMTVPKYYYRLTASGGYANGSGCGNEMASNAAMYRKFMIESLKHWMEDYHINGFRFDLMGLHETSTMLEIYEALKEIDPNVMVYGEPWTGGTSPVVNGVEKKKIDDCAPSLDVNGVACFNDDIRNAIKGAEFGGFQQGQVQGVFSGNAINCGLQGSIKTVGNANKFTSVAGRSINYVECHDNYTLFDKLAISYLNKTSFSGDLFAAIGNDGLNAVKAQNKLSAAYIFLAQGTPFINGGQEFMRTKQGDENSYSSPDAINEIDFDGFMAKHRDVYNVYKGLIALRKSSDAFTAGKNVTAETVKNASGVIGGFTKYVTEGTNDAYCVYFNASSSTQTIDTAGYSQVVTIDTGLIVESATLPTNVGAKSFVILKK